LIPREAIGMFFFGDIVVSLGIISSKYVKLILLYLKVEFG